MANGTIGMLVQEPNPAAAIAAIKRFEAAGVPVAWATVGSAGGEPLPVFAAAATQTERIQLGTCIVPILTRHPLVMAQLAAVVAALAPGRFRLGLGPSHKPSVEGTYGMPFRAPLGHLREYMQIVRAALEGGSVDFDGRYYHAHTRTAPVPGPAVPIMASALRERAFHLCGELSDGGISWVCPLAYLRDVALPALKAGAAAAGRPAPPLVAHVPVCLSDDADAARAAARRSLAVYPRLPYYAQMMVDAGLPDAPRGEWSDEMVDAIVVHGSEQRVVEGLQAYLDAGFGELIVAPILVGEREPELQRLAELVAGLAR